MVRCPDYRTDREADLDSTMTPMIDVVFLLLIFFIWTAGSQIVEYVLPSQLANVQGNEPSQQVEPEPEDDFDRVIVRVRYDAQLPDWTINDQPMLDITQVAETLTRLAQIRQDTPLIVHPDSNVPLGFVVEVYDQARLSGFDKISFSVNQSL